MQGSRRGDEEGESEKGKQKEEMEGEAERAEREGKRDRGALNGQPRQRKIVWRPGDRDKMMMSRWKRYRDTVKGRGRQTWGQRCRRWNWERKMKSHGGNRGPGAGWGSLVEALGVLAGGGARAGAGGRAIARDVASAGRWASARF